MAFATEPEVNAIREQLMQDPALLATFDKIMGQQKELIRFVEDFTPPEEPMVDNGVGRGPRPLSDLLEMMWEFAQPNQAKVLRAAISFVHNNVNQHNGRKKV